jgi:hypothetical protein
MPKKGNTPWNKGKKGLQVAWNKDTIGVVKPNSGSFKKGEASWNAGTAVVKVKRPRRANSTSFEKGMIPYNKGLKLSEAVRKNISISHLGVPNKSKGKSRPEFSGENHPNWKGGNGSIRHQSMGKLEYRNWRDAVFYRDNYTCQICEQYSGTLHADHIERWADNEELRYTVDNGRTLCVPCHYYITFKRKMKPNQRWCNFTAKKEG